MGVRIHQIALTFNKQKGFLCLGQYLEKTRQDTYTLLKRNISSHLKGLRVVILSRKSARIVYITENLKQNII